MINQLLNRAFILEQLRQVEEYLSLPEDDRRRDGAVPREAESVAREDLQATLAQVQRSRAKERTESSGQPAFRLRGGEPPLDDWSFFSRDAVVSNLQTVLDYYFTDGPGAGEVQLEPVPVTDRRGAGQESLTGEYSLPGFDARLNDGRRLFDQFSVSDIGWVSIGLAAGLRLFRGRHAFINTPSIVPMKNRTRLLLVGDWGSGIPRARKVAMEMRKFIDQGLTESYELHVIHLGDVYYSGWQREYEKRFLAYWPVRPEEADRIHSWSLNGNHDMYSGGFGYYDFLLRDPRFRLQNGCSFFSLENQYWKIFGLDSSWEDGGLQEPQSDWLSEKLDPTKKTMLISHHQPFSSYETAAKTMTDKLANPLIRGRGVKAWFWGHEHRFMLFDPYENVEFGRLIGHGGVPVYMAHNQNDPYPAPGVYEYRKFIPSLLGLEHWAYFGFAVLDFIDDKIEVRYLDEDGKEAHPIETIV